MYSPGNVQPLSAKRRSFHGFPTGGGGLATTSHLRSSLTAAAPHSIALTPRFHPSTPQSLQISGAAEGPGVFGGSPFSHIPPASGFAPLSRGGNPGVFTPLNSSFAGLRSVKEIHNEDVESHYSLWSTRTPRSVISDNSSPECSNVTPFNESFHSNNARAGVSMGSPSELDFENLKLHEDAGEESPYPTSLKSPNRSLVSSCSCDAKAGKSNRRVTLPSSFKRTNCLDETEEMCVSDDDSSTSVWTCVSHKSQGNGGVRKRKKIEAKKMPVMMEDINHVNGNAKPEIAKANLDTKNGISSRACCTFAVRFGLVLVITGAVILGSYQATHCDISKYDLQALQKTLEENVFGQHIAVDIVLQQVQRLIGLGEGSPNVTVLSFHGWTGVGKNHISGLISQHLAPSSTIRVIIPLHFPRHVETAEDSRQKMFEWITKNVSSCCLNVFIVDEVDHASDEVLAGLKAAVQHLRKGVPNDVKVLILLLSNTDASRVNQLLTEWLLVRELPREALRHEHFLNAILDSNGSVDQSSDSSQGWHVDMYKDGAIDVLVPFLPLEKLHVRKCIKRHVSLSRSQHSQPISEHDLKAIVNEVIPQMSFFPTNSQLFSITGCRAVSAKVDLIDEI